MKTMKLTALFAVMSMAAGIAVAQPADTTGTRDQRQRPRAERPNMGAEQGDSPIAKLRIAHTLETLTAEQKARISEFMEARKEDFDGFRTEMRSAMQKAREGTDREARRQMMEPLRQKHETMRQEVDTFLKGVLSSEQMQELEDKAKNVMERGRMGRRADDKETTGAREGRRGDRRGGMKSRDDDKATTTAASSTDDATTGTNPFANESE